MEPHKALGHGGDVYRNPVSHDFSINLNPLGMPQGVKKVLKHSVDGWARYPDPECEALKNALAGYHHVPAEWILCANGAADLIFQAVRILAPKKALLFAPSFSEYRQALMAAGPKKGARVPAGYRSGPGSYYAGNRSIVFLQSQ